ncbi:hypothetical protein, partial [Rhizobium rhizogenes]
TLMAARKPNHPLQRYEKRAAARLCYLPPPTPRAGTRSVSIIAKAIPSSAMMDLSAPVRGRVRHIPVVSMVPQVLRIQIPWK